MKIDDQNRLGIKYQVPKDLPLDLQNDCTNVGHQHNRSPNKAVLNKIVRRRSKICRGTYESVMLKVTILH